MTDTSPRRGWIAWIVGLAALALVIRFAGGSIMTALRHAHGMH